MTASVYDNSDSGGRLSEKQLFVNMTAYDDGEGTTGQTISYLSGVLERPVDRLAKGLKYLRGDRPRRWWLGISGSQHAAGHRRGGED